MGAPRLNGSAEDDSCDEFKIECRASEIVICDEHCLQGVVLRTVPGAKALATHVGHVKAGEQVADQIGRD
jgi:hypothetical protein